MNGFTKQNLFKEKILPEKNTQEFYLCCEKYCFLPYFLLQYCPRL